MTVEIVTRGLDALREMFEELPEKSETAAVRAVNHGARKANTLARRRMQEQVEFKPGYLTGKSGDGKPRLGVIKFASANSTEAVIRGRERPTSLARFVQGSKATGRRDKGRPVRVNVGGQERKMPSAWLVNLRRGSGDGGGSNLGLAIRLPKGQRLNKKILAKPLGRGAYLLYGPSVAQVFDDVALEITDEVSDVVEGEFVRQIRKVLR